MSDAEVILGRRATLCRVQGVSGEEGFTGVFYNCGPNYHSVTCASRNGDFVLSDDHPAVDAEAVILPPAGRRPGDDQGMARDQDGKVMASKKALDIRFFFLTTGEQYAYTYKSAAQAVV